MYMIQIQATGLPALVFERSVALVQWLVKVNVQLIHNSEEGQMIGVVPLTALANLLGRLRPLTGARMIFAADSATGATELRMIRPMRLGLLPTQTQKGFVEPQIGGFRM